VTGTKSRTMYQPDDKEDDDETKPRGPVKLTYADLEANTRILSALGWIAWGLESSLLITIPYYKSVTFGLSSILAFIPENPFVSPSHILGFLAVYIVFRAYFLKPTLPSRVYIRALFNLFLGVVFSRIPWFGAMLLGWWKPNQSNVAMLEELVPYIDYDKKIAVNNGSDQKKKN
jgi:hypothetical protein